MLKCKDIAQGASHYLDPNLPWHKKWAWYLHLSMCNNCRRFVRQFNLTVAVAKRLTQPKATEPEVQQAMEKIKNTD